MSESDSPPETVKAPSRAVLPRGAPSDAFEQNPLHGIGERIDRQAVALMEDGERVREALRHVIEENRSIDETAREWNVAPSILLKWRARYYDLINRESVGTPGVRLLDTGELDARADLISIPAAAQARFAENWQLLLEATHATPETFHQPSWRLFLENSWVSSWLFTEGRLDRGILSGAVSAVVGLALTASFLLANRTSQAPPSVPVETVLSDEMVIARAAEVAKAFFGAPNQEERLKYVRDPGAARELMREFYKTHPDGPLTGGALGAGMTSRNVTSVSLTFESVGRPYFVNVVSDRSGTMKVDWETSSLYQETNLEELRRSRHTGATRVSVNVEAGDYWNYQFADAAKWVCFRLTYPGLDFTLYGYAAVGSREAVTLGALTSTTMRPPMVLEVKFPPDSPTDNQVEITAVLAEEWVSGS